MNFVDDSLILPRTRTLTVPSFSSSSRSVRNVSDPWVGRMDCNDLRACVVIGPPSEYPKTPCRSHVHGYHGMVPKPCFFAHNGCTRRINHQRVQVPQIMAQYGGSQIPRPSASKWPSSMDFDELGQWIEENFVSPDMILKLHGRLHPFILNNIAWISWARLIVKRYIVTQQFFYKVVLLCYYQHHVTKLGSSQIFPLCIAARKRTIRTVPYLPMSKVCMIEDMFALSERVLLRSFNKQCNLHYKGIHNICASKLIMGTLCDGIMLMWSPFMSNYIRPVHNRYENFKW